MIYLIGDLQGCCDALDRLLATLDFSPSRDRFYVLGDLVNRGPCSRRTLHVLRGFGDAATCLLGNHDLHLLAVAHGVRPLHRSDTVRDILDAPDRDELLDWLRQQRMAVQAHGWLMVHAGVAPAWDAALTLQLAGEVEAALRSPEAGDFFHAMYGNEPARWSDDLQGHDRLRNAVNTLTRLRFCTPDGHMDFAAKDGADQAPPGHLPWFEVPGRKTAGVPIAFGHWSTLGLINRPDLLALDTGCVWGGQLTAARIDGGRREIIQVPCQQAQKSG
ncbi:symmetrical bis(5'-nucleosyl)-tetraphosphatase [Caldimonas thermodepolymerans]|uniref:symmetrical bis(5'-nucleosyl)-tetraphosphatase n=1 Tax=Caldimonas thermodepolymerans TaxID=215580 RepID=UPI0022365F7E|nr:symmetrical bis(5'-nucleosyl)-tetraphosphatase [Caldimonas thermodepolymerans]UZG45388.1 symmetrical bis(5'-nucleosyl)-tetraphosphatase [Caldimonas thermodepolymerans]